MRNWSTVRWMVCLATPNMAAMRRDGGELLTGGPVSTADLPAEHGGDLPVRMFGGARIDKAHASLGHDVYLAVPMSEYLAS